jgi:hypothetical protein
MPIRWLLAAGLQVLLCGGLLAKELPADLRGLIEGFQSYRRVAIGYLRTQNVELGAVEIERLRERWARDRKAAEVAAQADTRLAAALAQTEARVAEGLAAADAGDADRARLLLEQAAAPLDAWRRANDIRLFSDCIAEVTAAYERLDGFRIRAPALADTAAADRIKRDSAATIDALARCDREAGEAQRHEPEFRRLIDGMLDSLRQMPEAVEARDGARLHRLLIEQRSFERLLSFRYG